MAFKRALWHSGLTYQQTCYHCRTLVRYTDYNLDFRPWYPDGFVYCPNCSLFSPRERLFSPREHLFSPRQRRPKEHPASALTAESPLFWALTAFARAAATSLIDDLNV